MHYFVISRRLFFQGGKKQSCWQNRCKELSTMPGKKKGLCKWLGFFGCLVVKNPLGGILLSEKSTSLIIWCPSLDALRTLLWDQLCRLKASVSRAPDKPHWRGRLSTYPILKPPLRDTMNPQENEATSEIHNSGLISASIAWCVPFTTRSPQACYLLLECYSLFDFQIILHVSPFTLSHFLPPVKSWHPKQFSELN